MTVPNRSSLPSPPLDKASFSQIQTLATDMEAIEQRTPREWFDRALRQVDLAHIAERKSKKEEMYIAYTKLCACYANCRMHPKFGAMKKEDSATAGRVKEFKDVSGISVVDRADRQTYEESLRKAQQLREELRKREG
jgi:ubiquitin carboxyl-terminal hydrolase 8